MKSSTKVSGELTNIIASPLITPATKVVHHDTSLYILQCEVIYIAHLSNSDQTRLDQIRPSQTTVNQVKIN